MAMVVTLDTRLTTTRQRQRLVRELARAGSTRPSEIMAELMARGVVNGRGQPFSLSTIRNDLRGLSHEQRVSEIIGRTVLATPIWKRHVAKSYDATQTDYQFWDDLRRGKAAGFKFGALFCMPLAQIIASFVFGNGLSAALAKTVEAPTTSLDYTNDLLSRLLSRLHRALGLMAIDLYGLGDQYAVVNPDSSLSFVSPESVEITPNDLDYRLTDKIAITTRLDKFTVTDEYTATQRVLRLRSGAASGKIVDEQVFENLIGRIPIVHFPNDRGTNEIYGRPIYEALYRLLSRYDDLIEKAIDGAELMGNPMPAFEGMENIEETIEANTTIDDETYDDADGNEETRPLLKFDRLGALFIGKGGSFNFKSPGVGFTDDIRNVLKSLFLLMLDYTRVPEAVWGGAIASSKASADAQMPPFYQYIESRRLALEGDGADDELGMVPRSGLYELMDLWLRTRALTDPRVVVGPTALKWPELNTADWQVLLKWTSYLRGVGVMDDLTTLEQFGQLEDPAAVLEKAQAEAEARKEEGADFAQRLKDAGDEADQEAQDGDNNTPDSGQESEGRGTMTPDTGEAVSPD
jgi:hypothetical protein